MTLNELKRYRSYCSELREIKHELNGGVSEESSIWLLYRKNELECRTKTIERFVESIPDYKVYRAIKMYCIESIGEGEKVPDWEDVAFRIGDGCTEGAIKQRVSRYLKKN